MLLFSRLVQKTCGLCSGEREEVPPEDSCKGYLHGRLSPHKRAFKTAPLFTGLWDLPYPSNASTKALKRVIWQSVCSLCLFIYLFAGLFSFSHNRQPKAIHKARCLQAHQGQEGRRKNQRANQKLKERCREIPATFMNSSAKTFINEAVNF